MVAVTGAPMSVEHVEIAGLAERAERFRCQCPRTGGYPSAWRCVRRMTQEDLRCDVCRDGCAIVWRDDQLVSCHARFELDYHWPSSGAV